MMYLDVDFNGLTLRTYRDPLPHSNILFSPPRDERRLLALPTLLLALP